ncbi:hypothetical protein PRK78_006843 [Emydomyces testavorans]|uniref:C2H2-type domain-containing protein n=1 Tax=Emydomyces testavorans TaxID=2070801 RepID=A0AAF0DMZ6_9EURO|nr:hypothetical protein PRK78_006843 [Emydomyces testavorans]
MNLEVNVNKHSCSDFCGLWYHHVREEESQMQELLPLDPDPPTLSLKTRGARDISESDLQESNFAGFRRVRIIAMVIRPPAMHKTLDDLKQNLVEHSPSNSAEPVDPQDAGHGLEKDANYAAFRTKQKIQHQARIWQLRKHRTQKTAAANSNAQGGQQVPDSSTNNNPDKRSVPSSTGRCKSCSAKFTVTGKVLLSTQYCSQCLHDQVADKYLAFSGVHRSKEPEPRDMSRERSMFGHEVPSNYQYDQETGAVSSTSEHQYRFVCDAPGCGTSFRRRYELVLHLRTHLEGYTLKKQREEVQWTLIDARMR